MVLITITSIKSMFLYEPVRKTNTARIRLIRLKSVQILLQMCIRDRLSAKALQAQSDLNAAESALVSLQEAYDRALSLQGSSTNEMSDARNALDRCV